MKETNDAFNTFLNSLNIRSCSFILFLFSFALYFNTTFNEYALDDGIVITENKFVQKGFAGIGDIFSHDTFFSVSGVKGELSGGRYRPLSVATFAVEYGLFGRAPGLSHFINVLMYALLCLMIFRLLHDVVFAGQMIPAFFSALIFAAHPTHTEIVANIKSRDELLAFLLIVFSIILLFKHLQSKNGLFLFLSLISFFVSLFSKESGIPYLAVVPLVLYFFTNSSWKKIIGLTTPFLMILMAYFFVRYSVVGMSGSQSKEVMNAPFILASADEALATKVLILGKYILLLLFPHPLSYDYSYPQIPYVNFSNAGFIVSFLINTALLVFALAKWKEKNLISFSILFYFITISIVSNFVFDVGAPMSDRFLFQPSLGFAIACICLGLGVFTIQKKKIVSPRRIRLLGLAIIPVLLLYAVKSISRNADWKNNDTLFVTDAKHSPKSAKTQVHAAVIFINKATAEKDSLKKIEYLNTAVNYCQQGIRLYPGYADALIDMGNALSQLDRLDEAKGVLLKARQIYPSNPVLATNLEYLNQKYLLLSLTNFKQKQLEEAVRNTVSAIECVNPNPKGWYYLGGYYLSLNQKDKAVQAWNTAHEQAPNDAEIKMWLDRVK